jgi:hypothetical protein
MSNDGDDRAGGAAVTVVTRATGVRSMRWWGDDQGEQAGCMAGRVGWRVCGLD